jgi:hypothetical protein
VCADRSVCASQGASGWPHMQLVCVNPVGHGTPPSVTGVECVPSPQVPRQERMGGSMLGSPG